jgi:thiol:disulfide interchange protein
MRLPIFGLLFAGLASLAFAGPARAQPTSSVELTTVKYGNLGEVVKKHRGKVVFVDFWSVY